MKKFNEGILGGIPEYFLETIPDELLKVAQETSVWETGKIS